MDDKAVVEAPAGTPPEPPAGGPRRLSEELTALRHRMAGQGMTLGELQDQLREHGALLMLLVLLAPFLLPVSIPLLSMPFGLSIGAIGAQLAFDRAPWLPAFIRRRAIQPATLDRLLGGAIRLAKWIEKVVRPRGVALFVPGVRHLAAAAVVTAAFYLCLPIPPVIPFTNWLPAVAILLTVFGLMERDAVSLVGGLLVQAGAWIYLAFWWQVIWAAVAKFWPAAGG